MRWHLIIKNVRMLQCVQFGSKQLKGLCSHSMYGSVVHLVVKATRVALR